MLIDTYGLHKDLPPEDVDAALLVQVISWIEESHYWRAVDPDQSLAAESRQVKCQWCGRQKDHWAAPLRDIDTDKLQICPGNPVIKGMMGDPTVPYTLSRIKA